MLQKLSLILFTAFLLSSCGNGPQVTVYVSDPAVGGLDGYNEATQKSSFVTYANSDKFVCFTPTDAQSLLSNCAQTPTNVAKYFKAHPRMKEFLMANGFEVPSDETRTE